MSRMRQNQDTCMVFGCEAPAHAKGYCGKHYGQMWRKGSIFSVSGERQHKTDTTGMNLINEYNKVKHLYNIVVGVENRVRYRKQLLELERLAEQCGINLSTKEEHMVRL